MRALSVSFLTLLVAAPALAQDITESVADVNFEVEQDLFRGTDIVRRVPETGSFYVELSVDIDASVEGELEGISTLEWPEAMTQSWEGVAGGGALDAELGMEVQLSGVFDGEISIFGFDLDFTGANRFSYPLFGENWTWFKTNLFDSVLLPGAATQSTTIQFDGENDATLTIWDLPLGDVNFEIPLVESLLGTAYYAEIGGSLEVRPDAEVTLTGERISTRGRDVLVHDGTVVVPAPNTNDGTADYESMWHGTAASTFGVIAGLRPSIVVGDTLDSDGQVIPISSGLAGAAAGILENLISDQTLFPINLATDERQIQSKNTDYTHDLPAIDVDVASLDFGTVDVGAEAQLNLVIEDLGSIDLFGDIVLEGDGFSISRPDIEVDGDDEMTLTVSFRPDAVADFDATITLVSNDPVVPSLAIPVTGTGFQEGVDPEPEPGDGPDGEAGIRGCGCSSAPTSGFAWLALIPAFGFVLRRRR